MIEIKIAAWELHLGSTSTLPRRFGEKIKAAGGSYSATRGYNPYRYVTLPEGQDELINAILTAYPGPGGSTGKKGPVVIARLGDGRECATPAWVTVCYLDRRSLAKLNTVRKTVLQRFTTWATPKTGKAVTQ